MIKVYPTKDSAKHLIHPTHGAISTAGSLWPQDAFTLRRLKDGSVSTVNPNATAPVIDSI